MADYETPTRARFQRTVSNAGFAARVRPALGEDAGLQAMKERFADTFDKKFLPANANQFRPEAMTTALKMNLQENNLLLTSDHTSGNQPVVIEVRPAFDRTVFFRTPPDHDVDKTYSVHTKPLASKMVQRGYVKIPVIHLPDDERELPPAVGDLVRGAQGGLSADALPPPVELKVPTVCPDINQAASAPTPAAQIVEWFEFKVIMLESGHKVVYSPMRLWSTSARSAAGFQPNQSTPFSTRCKLYLYIRRHLSDEEPAEIRLTYDALRQGAKEKLIKYSAKQAREKEAAGAELEPTAIVGDWWSAAQEEANKWLNA